MKRFLFVKPLIINFLFPDELATPMAPRNSGCTDHHYWTSGYSGSPRRSEVSEGRHTGIRLVLNLQGHVKSQPAQTKALT